METATQSIITKHAPVRQGHFLLSSGMHSPSFIELEPIVQDPALAASIVKPLADLFRDEEPHVVIAASGPDAILGFELARQLGARAVFADGPLGQRTVRHTFKIKPGERAVVLIGVIVTGDSARELIRIAESDGGRAVGVAVLVDRSGARLDVGAPLEALSVVDLETYFAPVCPLCAAGRPLERRQE
ncbi:MAG TPA: orotate phosphoribosyltransferase [bacterium]